MTVPRVSVVMPVFNGVDYLAETLDSLRMQSLGDFELVVVDDGSTDGSWELLREYARSDERMRLYRHNLNRGHRAASNRAFSLARAPYVARHDQDDISSSRRLQLQVDYLDHHPDVGLVSCAARKRNRSGITRTTLPPTEHALVRWGLLFDMVFCHSSLVFRREFVIGPNAYRYAPAACDYEVCARLGRETRLAALPQPLVTYRVHDAGLSAARADAMRRSAAAISARQIRRLLAPKGLGRREIEALRRLATGRAISKADLASIPLLLKLMDRFGGEDGVSLIDLQRIRRTWQTRLVRRTSLRLLAPLLARDPAGLGARLVERIVERGGRWAASVFSRRMMRL